jgi:hypothetical protein
VAKSHVAGIISPNGAVRYVVTEKWRFKYHLQPGERLFVVPKLRVREPIVWEQIPTLINAVNDHIKRCS